MRQRLIGGTSAMALLLLSAAYTYHYLYWDFDDGYIIFRIVRNLLNGQGWAFNPGEAHNASTSVLNTMAITAAAPLFAGHIPLAAHILAGLWIVVGAVTFAWTFSQRFDSWIALGAGVALVVTLADNVLWGLETHLFVALFGIFTVLEHRRRSSWALIGLLTLTRPDALLLAGLRGLRAVSACTWQAHWPGWRESVRRVWTEQRAGVLIFALVLAPWALFSLVTFHQLFPDTLANKMWQGRSGFWGTGAVYLKGLLGYIGSATPWQLAGYVLAVPGVAFMVRDQSVLLYVVAFAAVQQIAYAVLNVPPYHWYFSFFAVAIVLAAFYGAGSIVRMLEQRLHRARTFAPAALYVAILVIAGVRIQPLIASHYPQDAREASYAKVAKAMGGRTVPPGPLAMIEVGTVGYYLPDRPIIDLLGLTSANPEYVTGRHSDRFFAHPPAVVLVRAPAVSAMERAIVDDIRFRMLYEDPVVVNTADPAMQYFALRRGARPPTDADIADHVRQAYAPFHPESAGPLAGAGHSLDALCALDSVNGTLITGPMQVPRTILTLIGWAYDRAEAGAPADVFAVLSSGERSYSLRASRVARPDVADAFEEPRFEMSGFTATGGIVDLPPGEYRVRLVQRRGEGFVSCDVPHRLAVTGAVR